MSVEGELIVKVRHQQGLIGQVDIRSTRPRGARLLIGRTPAQAAALAPLLFSICGQAQGAAARVALAAAAQTGLAPAVLAQSQRAVCAEAIAETLWRLLIDWPRACGLAPQTAPVAAARALAATAATSAGPTAAIGLAQLASDHVFGEPALAWLARDAAGVLTWLDQAGTAPARALAVVHAEAQALAAATPVLPAAGLHDLAALVSAALDADADFEAAPTWAGATAETGAWPRHHRHPLLADWQAAHGDTPALRVLARLLDLALALHELAALDTADTAAPWVAGHSPHPGTGISAAHTARGLLVHQARVDGGQVLGYRIVAPTEWNFHPAGALARGLVGQPQASAAAAAQAASRLAQALDPCVAWRVEVDHA